jgi:hypothetical protein
MVATWGKHTLAAKSASFLTIELVRRRLHIFGALLAFILNVWIKLLVLHPKASAALPSGSARATKGYISRAPQLQLRSLGIGEVGSVSPAFKQFESVRKIVITLSLLAQAIFYKKIDQAQMRGEIIKLIKQ